MQRTVRRIGENGQPAVLKTRVVTAIVLGILVVGAVVLLPPAATAMLLSVFVIIAAWEWSGLIGWTSTGLKIGYSVLIAVLALAIWRWNQIGSLFVYLNVLALVWWSIAAMAVVAAQLERLGRFGGLVTNSVSGLMVLLPAWSGIVWLLENDRAMLLTIFALIWVADGAAFFVGKRWGRTKLASKVSPGKTWEGVAGGLGFGVFCAIILSQVRVLSDAAMIAFIGIAVAAISASVVGDLFESMVKRRIGVKDSGQILPGHGGVMDRIDGLVAAAPIFVVGLHYGVNRL